MFQNLRPEELLSFFEGHPSKIFHIVYDAFSMLEIDNKTKNSILDVLLNDVNSLKLRVRGLRIFISWYQILGQNASPECHIRFRNLVPDLRLLISDYHRREESYTPSSSDPHFSRSPKEPPKATPKDMLSINLRSHISFSSFPVQPWEISFTLPSLLDKSDESTDTSFELLRYLLRFLVTEVTKIEWKERKWPNYLLQFFFLFEKFKRSYLPVIFPSGLILEIVNAIAEDARLGTFHE
ncbi:unnamed protein product, partial [Protopolystoma xenopodis]